MPKNVRAAAKAIKFGLELQLGFEVHITA